MTPARYLTLYGRMPRIEHELTGRNGERTGRTRRRQFVSFPRPHIDGPKLKPIVPWEFA